MKRKSCLGLAKVREKLHSKLRRQKYFLAGEHSGVKLCTWTKKSLRDMGYCYKQQFYGIRSHMCCQMSPSIGYCMNSCIFCWREIELTLGASMQSLKKLDEPKDIVGQSILGQRKLVSGFGGASDVNRKKLAEAMEPAHFAISLTGEPLLYPKLNGLIRLLHKMGKTTFVVTNGQLPEVMQGMEMPTQLYVSVDAPNEQLFRKIERSSNTDGWKRLCSSLSVMKGLRGKTRTTLRLTIIKGLNDREIEGWSSMLRAAAPLFVEVKAYMFVGSSRMRLSIKEMPLHSDILAFSEMLSAASGYRLVDHKPESRVALLMKKDFPGRIMSF